MLRVGPFKLWRHVTPDWLTLHLLVCNDKIATLTNELIWSSLQIPNCHLYRIILQFLANIWIESPSLVVTWNFALCIAPVSFLSCHLFIKVIFTHLPPTSLPLVGFITSKLTKWTVFLLLLSRFIGGYKL